MAEYSVSLSQLKNDVRAQFYTEADYPPIALTPHFHSSYELVYAAEGSFVLTSDGLSERLSPGDYAMIMPYSVHSYRFEGPFRLRFIMIPNETVPSFSNRMEAKVGTKLVFHMDPEISAFVQNHLPTPQGDGRTYIYRSALYAALSEYLRLVPLRDKPVRKESLMKEMLIYISEHYSEKISLKTMADHLGYEYTYLSHRFKSFLNLSFTDYLMVYRLDQAAKDLSSSDLSVIEIAEKNGFSSSGFYRAFLKAYHVSPAQYRNQGRV